MGCFSWTQCMFLFYCSTSHRRQPVTCCFWCVTLVFLSWFPIRQQIPLELLVLFSSHWAAEHLPTSLTTAAFYWTQTHASFALQNFFHSENVCAFCDRSLPAADPRVWNELPVVLRAPNVTFNYFGPKRLFILVWWGLDTHWLWF